MWMKLRRAFMKIDLAFIRTIRVLSVKARFILLVTFISIVPILVIGLFTYTKADADIIDKMSTYSLQLVSKIGENLEQKVLSFEKYGDIIAISKTVQDILSADQNKKIYEDYVSVRALENVMKESLKVSLEIQEPDMITSAGEIISPVTNSQPFVNDMEPERLKQLKQLTLEANGSYVWNTDDIETNRYLGNIIISRSIKDIDTFRKSLGFLLLQVNSAYLYDIYKDVNLGNGSTIYLIDDRGLIISSTNKGSIGSYFSKTIFGRLREQTDKGIIRATIKNVDSSYLAAYSSITKTGWTVVALIPNTYLNNLSRDILNLVLLVGIVCLAVSLFLFTLIYRSITKPLNKLIKSMRQVKKGDLSLPVMEDEQQDEVGEVINSYNRMIGELDRHIDSIKAKEKQKAEAEFRTLQAQINPHFIANTLNNIAWMAKIQKAENIETVSTSLIQLLHASMGRGGDLIPLREEIQNIEHYVTIMKYKYVKELDVQYDISPEIEDCKVLRFVLQPLVENAILHGIGPKPEPGFISIKGYPLGDTLTLVVTDTGTGMDEEEIRRLLAGEPKSRERFNSIGLRNIHERIRLSYGDGYGLDISGQKGLFTTVQVRMPLLIS